MFVYFFADYWKEKKKFVGVNCGKEDYSFFFFEENGKIICSCVERQLHLCHLRKTKRVMEGWRWFQWVPALDFLKQLSIQSMVSLSRRWFLFCVDFQFLIIFIYRRAVNCTTYILYIHQDSLNPLQKKITFKKKIHLFPHHYGSINCYREATRESYFLKEVLY